MIRQRVDQLLADHRAAAQQVATERTALRALKRQQADVAQAQTIVQHVAAAVQRRAHKQIATLVTRCLQAIYRDGRQFKLVFERKAGKTWARPVLVKNGHEEKPRPGGEADVICFALRVACLLTARPEVRRLLVLDEPFKHLNGRVYQERVEALLTALAREMKIQFIIATDDDWLKLGTVVEL